MRERERGRERDCVSGRQVWACVTTRVRVGASTTIEGWELQREKGVSAGWEAGDGVGLGGGELQGCKSVKGQAKGKGQEQGRGGGKRPRGGREQGRLRLIRGRPPYPLSPFFPFHPRLALFVSRPPSLLHSRHDLTNSLCALLLVLFLSAAISSPFGSPLISIVANSMPRRPVVSP